MQNPEIPGVLATIRVRFPLKKHVSISDLRATEEATLHAFRQVVVFEGAEIHTTSSGIMLGSIVLEVSVWVGGIISFLKLYPSVKKGLLELLQDIKSVIVRNRDAFPEGSPEVPEIDLLSVAEKLPDTSDIFIMGIDLFQLFVVSNSDRGLIKDAKFLIAKYVEFCESLSLDVDAFIRRLLLGDVEALEDAAVSLRKFGPRWPQIFRLGVQIMNLHNARSRCHRTREYHIAKRVSDQVLSVLSELELDERVVEEIVATDEGLRDAMLLEADEFERSERRRLERTTRAVVRQLRSHFGQI
jgi:hypothetical protein